DQSRVAPETLPHAAETVAPVDDDQARLPVPLTGLVGRETELEAPDRMLHGGSVRLLTLTGPGGIGKSRLAIAAAERAASEFPGGVRFVDFSAVREPALVFSTIAQALGVRDIGDTPVIDKLATAMRSRRILLILDN